MLLVPEIDTPDLKTKLPDIDGAYPWAMKPEVPAATLSQAYDVWVMETAERLAASERDAGDFLPEATTVLGINLRTSVADSLNTAVVRIRTRNR